MLIFRTIKKSFQILVAFLILISIISCDDEWRRPRNMSSWESTDPMSIPFRTRYKNYLAANLAPNPGFEKGRIYNETEKQQNVTRWEIFGDMIKYLENDSNSSFTPFESRCILIENNIYDETAKSEQYILSDFIEVIPGSYDLSLMLKLENIQAYNHRNGNNLDDAINIRLLFFDHNRKEINSRINFFENGNFYDASNRSLVFSNFSEINELDWTNIYAESFDNELLSGYIPSETKFVKIKIGLKGTGKMWVDDVIFQYSKQNFSFKEKTDFYRDSIYKAENLLIPFPKYLGENKILALVLANETEITYPTIINLFDNNEKSNLIINNFNNKANKIIKDFYPDSEIKNINKIESSIINKSSILFLFRKINKTYDSKILKAYPDLEIKNDAYIIIDTVWNGIKTIEIAAHNIYGLHYATNTLLKMFDNLSCVLNFADVYDYPDIDYRGIQFNYDNKSNTFNDISFLSSLNFNAIFFPKYKLNLDGELIVQSNKTQDLMTHFPQITSGETIDSEVFEYFENSEKKNNINSFIIEQNLFMSSADYQKQTNVLINKLTNNNIQSQHETIIVIDNKKDKNLSHHKSLESNTLNIVYQNYSKIGINFFTQQVQLYLNTLKKQNPSSISPKFIIYDNTYFKFPFYCDNFNPYYTNIVKTLSLFEPYRFRNNISNLKELNFIFRIDSINEIQKIKLQILSEFLWNAETYSPELTAYKVLLNNFGTETTKKLINFNDLYVRSLSYINRLKLQKKIERNALRNLEIAINKLEEILIEIEKDKQIKTNDLSKELRNLTNLLEIEYKKAQIEQKIIIENLRTETDSLEQKLTDTTTINGQKI